MTTMTTMTLTRHKGYKPFDTAEISAETPEKCFLKFYKMNKSLTYCAGEYYKFANPADEKAYERWYDSLSNDTKFGMYYEGTTVD